LGRILWRCGTLLESFVVGCLVAREDNGMVGTLSSLFVLAFRRAGNFGFFVGRLFDFGSGIGAVGWRRTFSSVFLSKGLA
jgi:hypothetical protein